MKKPASRSATFTSMIEAKKKAEIILLFKPMPCIYYFLRFRKDYAKI